SEYHGDHGPDADGAEHEDDRLRTRRHVDRDPVALVDPKSAQRGRDALRLLEQLRVREGLALAALVLGDERDALAVPGLDVMVDAVVREVRAPAEVPAERRLLPVEDALPLLEPWQRLGGLPPDAFRVVGSRPLPVRDAGIELHHMSLPPGGQFAVLRPRSQPASRSAEYAREVFLARAAAVALLVAACTGPSGDGRAFHYVRPRASQCAAARRGQWSRKTGTRSHAAGRCTYELRRRRFLEPRVPHTPH